MGDGQVPLGATHGREARCCGGDWRRRALHTWGGAAGVSGGHTAPLAPFASVERFPGAIFATARSGNPEATSTDLARASEALGLFVGDTVACLDRNG